MLLSSKFICQESQDLVCFAIFILSRFAGEIIRLHGIEAETRGLFQLTQRQLSLLTILISGTLTGLKLYLSEIISLCEQLFDSQSWDRKAQAASTISAISKSLFSSTDTQNANLVKPEVVNKLLVMLLTSASGNRFWRGKELVIGAIGDLCESSKKLILETIENEDSGVSKEQVRSFFFTSSIFWSSSIFCAEPLFKPPPNNVASFVGA